MTNIQRAFCVFLSLIFLCVVAALTGDFFKHGEIYRQLPLYCFLEKKALQEETGRDRETEMLLKEKNEEHLGEEVEAENRKEQEALLMAEAEEAEKKEEKQKKEVQKSEEKSADSTENKKDTGVENKEPEITKPEITQMEITPAGSDAAEKKASVEKTVKEQETVAVPHPQIDLSPAKLADFDYVMNQFFILDSNTETNAQQISGTRFLGEDLSIKQDSKVPQILIYHTHSQEMFADSDPNDVMTGVMGTGEYLTSLLQEKYGFQVMHHMGQYDVGDRDHAYANAEGPIEQLLAENPSIEVVIDLHRDAVDKHMVREVNGVQMAPIMFFNGLSRTKALGDISYLNNPNLTGNLAFSLQMQIAAAEYYPNLTRPIYLKGYRYNMHFKEKYLLIEMGSYTNTQEEARNAMVPLADLLNRVLHGEN